MFGAGVQRVQPFVLTDIDINYLLLYFEVNYGLTVEKKIQDAVMVIANENRYHPVCDFLNVCIDLMQILINEVT